MVEMLTLVSVLVTLPESVVNVGGRGGVGDSECAESVNCSEASKTTNSPVEERTSAELELEVAKKVYPGLYYKEVRRLIIGGRTYASGLEIKVTSRELAEVGTLEASNTGSRELRTRKWLWM